jgi:transketolase
MAYVLWDRFLRHHPRNPAWFNRDRFILSAGHGSALLYALLYLTGYDLPLEELQRSGSGGARLPATPSTDTHLGWRPRPVPWARALPWGWAWLSSPTAT